MARIPKIVSLPEVYWEKILQKKKDDVLIRNRSDALLVVLREKYPELREKE